MDTQKHEYFYTTQELADVLRVNVMTVYRYIKAHKIRASKIGKEYRIEKKEFDDFIKRTSGL